MFTSPFQSITPQGDGNLYRAAIPPRSDKTLSIHYPARGRKLPIQSRLNVSFFLLSIHYPARGRKRLLFQHIQQASAARDFQSITPQGDGNAYCFSTFSRRRQLGTFNPLPRKGTETSSFNVNRETRIAFNPLPRKGTETRRPRQGKRCSAYTFNPLPRKGTETLLLEFC